MATEQDQKSLPRYMGIPTFMRTPYHPDPEGLDIALIGVPYDGGVTNRPGARHGPREIRNQSSLMRSIHHVSRIDPYALCKVADIGDVTFEGVFDHDAVVRDIESFFVRVHAAGVLPLSAGGDHSVTYPIMKAIARDAPLGLIHIDAHTDTWDEFQGSKFMHGTPFRRAHEDGLLDAAREEFTQMGVEAVIKEARRVVGDGPTYISFDVDGLDPVYAPGTGTPEIGGITTIEALTLLRGLRNLNLVGGDVVEVAPPFDPSGNTALVGATLMYEILCLLAEVIANR